MGKVRRVFLRSSREYAQYWLHLSTGIEQELIPPLEEVRQPSIAEGTKGLAVCQEDPHATESNFLLN